MSLRLLLQVVSIVVALATALGGATAPPARADADPASDVLLGSSAFYPFQPPVSTALQNQLQQELSQLQKQGLTLKVAIIESPVDLGAIPNMFGKPQTYAEFLEHEISFQQPLPLLVVMPSGFGVSPGLPAAALSGLKVDATGQSNGLARSAIVAVQRLAKATGKPISGPASVGSPSSGGTSSGGTSPLITVGVPVAVVLLIVSLLALRQRRERGEGPRGRGWSHRG